ncbi:hypothetical protein FXO38_28053 [Capsicum annuum]|nr:hypothetical protein FXO38_28053 [Capsicum annuum]
MSNKDVFELVPTDDPHNIDERNSPSPVVRTATDEAFQSDECVGLLLYNIAVILVAPREIRTNKGMLQLLPDGNSGVEKRILWPRTSLRRSIILPTFFVRKKPSRNYLFSAYSGTGKNTKNTDAWARRKLHGS